MNLKSLSRSIFCACAIFCSNYLSSQNLLDTSSWLVGQGNVTGFNVSGNPEENIREVGINNNGNEVVLWKATPDINTFEDGGWNSDYIPIDNTKTYRLTVWIKKTNSDSGVTSFGTNSITNGTQNLLQLNGSINPYPYFWNGDLPQNNRWYLLVGFVHDKNHISTISQGKIYDGVTGDVVADMTDYKFNANATFLMHRSYLYSVTNIYDRQFFWDPRIEVAEGNETPIEDLLNISQNPKLLFSYDNAGNQKQRFYCAMPGCTIPDPPAGRPANETPEIKIEIEDEENEVDVVKVELSPNPTNGIVTVKLNTTSGITLTDNINIYNISGTLINSFLCGSKNELDIDLSNFSSGIYFVHLHLSNGEGITKQIIKN